MQLRESEKTVEIRAQGTTTVRTTTATFWRGGKQVGGDDRLLLRFGAMWPGALTAAESGSLNTTRSRAEEG